jgi:hypothetical protein
MKKAFLLIALLLVSFWCINVKADDDTTLPVATDPENAEIEIKKEEKVEEPKQEEVKAPEVKAEAKAEPTRGDTKADGEAEDVNAEYTVTVNIYDTRTNKIVKSFTTKSTASGTSSQTVKSAVYAINDNFTIASGDYIYTFDGFYTAKEGGDKIDKDYTPGSTYPSLLKLYSASDATKPASYRLYAQANSDITADDTVDVYMQWTKVDRPKTVVKFVFKEEDMDGNFVNSGNGVATTQTSTLHDTDGTSKTTRALQFTTFGSGPKYTVKGWYDENGNPVPESMYYVDPKTNEVDSNRIVVPYKRSSDSPAEVTITYILKWEAEKANKYTLVVHDEVSTSGGSWSNGEGHFGTYSHTFSEPEGKTHYQFLYYKVGDKTFKAGETYNHDVTNQGAEEMKEDAYAYWQPDVTLDLYDGDNKFISSESSFESVSINYDTTRVGYNFLGWFDANGNEVTETTFYPNEAGTKPEPKQITLYAKYEQILIDVSVAKEWNDEEDQDGLRPDSIDVTLSNGTKVTLNEENKWTATVKDVPEYEDGEKVKYTWTEETPEGYELTDTVLDEENNLTTLINTHIPKLIEITVTKVWADDENESGKRPESVTVALVVDEEEIDTVELNNENDWTHTFKELPAYSNKEEIKYEVREVEVPEGYEVAYEETEDGYIIHNVLGQGEGEPDEPTYDNPQTGDNIGLYVLGLVTSLSGLVVCVKKYNFE